MTSPQVQACLDSKSPDDLKQAWSELCQIWKSDESEASDLLEKLAKQGQELKEVMEGIYAAQDPQMMLTMLDCFRHLVFPSIHHHSFRWVEKRMPYWTEVFGQKATLAELHAWLSMPWTNMGSGVVAACWLLHTPKAAKRLAESMSLEDLGQWRQDIRQAMQTFFQKHTANKFSSALAMMIFHRMDHNVQQTYTPKERLFLTPLVEGFLEYMPPQSTSSDVLKQMLASHPVFGVCNLEQCEQDLLIEWNEQELASSPKPRL